MAVFRKSSAPHFLVGRDRVGKLRLAQLVPLGKLTCALENDPGGIETNRWVRALPLRSRRAQWSSLFAQREIPLEKRVEFQA
jgi:hypothetical protein